MREDVLNAERLLALYERVADAPDAIPHLRRFVLDLAVRGKLVEQDPDDEPASELLERIAAEKERLAGVGEIKKSKPSDPLNSDDIAFAVPPSWTWARLAEIAVCLDYMRKPINITERLKRIEGKSKYELYPYFGATQQQGWIDEYIFDEELVLLGEDGVPFFDPFRPKAYLIKGKTWVNNHAHVFKGILISHPFLAHYLNIFDYTGRVVGATRSKLNQARAVNIPVPVPPLAEQHRIVAKVEELMALLDRLEETRTTAETTRDRLTASSLTRLTAPDTIPEAFPDHARFVFDALPALTTRANQIQSLRQTILNLAVRGKLVEQDPTDEPASELLKRIVEEKTHLAKSGEIKRNKPLPPLTEEELAFDIPTSWAWCRFGSLVLASDAGWSPLTESHARKGDAWGVLKVSAVSWDYFDPDENKQILPGTEPRLKAKVRKGDFLISRANTAELVARAVLVRDEPQKLMMSDKIVRLRLATALNHQFAWLVNNNAEFARNYYAANATGVSPSMKNVSRTVILELPIPLPPLAEQNRIVAKVDELMALCDRLEAALTTSNTTKQRLLEALLHEALVEGAQNREAA